VGLKPIDDIPFCAVIPGRASSREPGIQERRKPQGRLDSGFAQARAPE
jgi:hypothetical protein